MTNNSNQILTLSIILLVTLVDAAFAFTRSTYHADSNRHRQKLQRRRQNTHLEMSDGKIQESFVISDFSLMEQLEEIVMLSSKAMPQRPDGLVCVAKWTSASRPECTQTESEYERLAREHPDTVFMRCFEEYDDALITINKAKVSTFPTFDVFYGGNRVARIEGPEYGLVKDQILRHGMINSKLDLFSEESELGWGNGNINPDYTATPRTTARFIPAYDWDKNEGFFDSVANKAAKDFEGEYENWMPPMDDK